jgi:hypothetical protein
VTTRPEELLRVAAADIPPEHVSLLAADVAPDRRRAAVLLAYAAQPEPYIVQAFLDHAYGEWGNCGEMDGLGPGWWDFGDIVFAVLSGRAESAVAVDVGLDDVVVRRPVTHGHFLAVIWEAGRPAPDPPPFPSAGGFTQSVWFGGGGAAERPVPRLLREHRDA